MIDQEKENLKRSLSAVLKKARNEEAAKWAVGFLFPTAVAERSSSSFMSAPGTSDRPISNDRYTRNYFRLDPPIDGWGRSEINEIIKVGPEIGIQSVISRIENLPSEVRKGLRSNFLELLADEFNHGDKLDHDWLLQLANIGPYFTRHRDEKPMLLWEIDNERRLEQIIFNGLRRKNPEERSELFLGVIPAADDVTLLCDVFRTLEGDTHSNDGAKRSADVNFGDNALEVRTQLGRRTLRMLDDQSVWNQGSPRQIFWFLYGSGSGDKVMQCISDALQHPELRSNVFELPISKVRSTGGDYDHVADYWSKLMNLDELEKEARGIVLGGEAGVEKVAAERFLNALERGRRDRG